MEINDSIYGEFEIKDKVILDLIQTETFQRLNKISQYGIPEKYYHVKGDFSRHEHSVGVMLFLRKFNASLEEQVSGLLHDVSHTAFSHIGDWIFGSSKEENYQDLNHKNFIENTGLSRILSQHGLDPDKVTNLHNYPLLDREKGELCADRIDYTLREIYYRFDKYFHEAILDDLILIDNDFVFKSKEKAKLFATSYLNLNVEHWGSPETLLRYKLFSLVLKNALDKKIINSNELNYNDDEYVMDKLYSSKDVFINDMLKFMSYDLKFRLDSQKNDFIFNDKKFRYVNPIYLSDKRKLRLSDNDDEFRDLLFNEMAKHQEGIKIELL